MRPDGGPENPILFQERDKYPMKLPNRLFAGVTAVVEFPATVSTLSQAREEYR